VGGRSLAAEEVCGGDLDTLGSLVDENLVRVEGERFGMFETIPSTRPTYRGIGSRATRREARSVGPRVVFGRHASCTDCAE
jgi:hypothetical protein